MKILVIEDHPTHLKLVNHVLSAAGHDVQDATASEQAFVAIKRDRPQIILLDLALPGVDGLTLVRLLKGDPDTRDIPVGAVTSYPEKYSKAAALAAGCDAYTREISGQLTTVAQESGVSGKSIDPKPRP